jgi:alpha-glucoside transport system substrate-binding protein
VRAFAAIAAAAILVGACSSSGTPAPGSSGGPSGTGPVGTLSVPSFGQIGGSVNVLAVWAGGTDPKSEEYAFRKVVAPFLAATGITLKLTSTRDVNASITAGLASGNVPDIAAFPNPGKVIELAKAGNIKPLDGLFNTAAYRADTAAASALVVNGQQYAEFFKGSIKGLIWYDPKVYTGGDPTSWDDLNTKATTALAALPNTKEWCIGLQSGAGSDGWPGTDWIEDFVIRQSGADVYDKWVNGTQKWSSAEIKAAFTEFGKALNNTYGDSSLIISTAFGKAGDPLFKTPPGCLFHHQASFITSFFQTDNPTLKAGTDYKFFLEPDLNPSFSGAVTGGGDSLAMFNDTPQAKALMQYLVTPQAQAIWPAIAGSGAISGSKSVSTDVYPDDITKTAAKDLASAKTFRFDGSDLMPAAMSDAFLKAILDYTKDQTKLDSILASLDTVQTSAYGG